jgi:spore maturation protein CgeB
VPQLVKIAFVDTYYRAFLLTHHLQSKDYQAELTRLLARQFATADFYSREFRDMGWETLDIVANYHELQYRWAREQGYPDMNRLQDIARTEIDQFDPDVVFVQDLSFFTVAELKALSRKYRLVAQCSCALPEVEKVQSFDILFTSFPHYLARLEALGVRAVFVPLAFHSSCLRPSIERTIDCAFVGGFGRHWNYGQDVLEMVAQEIPGFQWWGYGVETLSGSSALKRTYQGQAWGDAMYSIYQRSKMVINRHGEVSEDYANNMRLYEATGSGALLVTDQKRNMRDLFSASEVVEYDSAEDAVFKVRYYLDHPDEAQTIADAGQERTIWDHSYAKRMKRISDVLKAA